MMACGHRVRTAISKAWKSLGGSDFTRSLRLFKGTAYFVLFVCCLGLIGSKLRELFSNDIGTEIKIQFAYEHALPTVAFCRYAHTSKKTRTNPCLKYLKKLLIKQSQNLLQSLNNGAPWMHD